MLRSIVDSSAQDKPMAKGPDDADGNNKETPDSSVNKSSQGPRMSSRITEPLRNVNLSSDEDDEPVPAKIPKVNADSALHPDGSIEWHTLATLSSDMWIGMVDLTDEQRAELAEICAPTQETGLSERISYAPDVHYKDTQEILSRCFNTGVLQNQQADPEVPKQTKKGKSVVEAPFDKPIPLLVYSYGYKDGVVRADGAAVVNKATCTAENLEHSGNSVYNSHHFRYVQSKIGKGMPPSRFFENRGFPQAADGEVGVVLPVVVLDITDPDLEKEATSLSSCLIRGCNEIIDTNAFSIAKLKDLCKGVRGTMLRQRPQHSTRNQKLKGGKSENWDAPAEPEVHETVKVLENYEEILETAREGYRHCTSTFPIENSALLDMQQKLKDVQLPCSTAAGKEPYPIVTFGTNLDVGDSPEQMKAIEKLPEFTRPNQRLMAIIEDQLPGINQVQVFLKTPGCRTVAHYENQGIGSININIGEDHCTWYCVPMKFSAALEKLMCQQNVWPYHTRMWPSEAELLKAGVSYSKFVQKRGEMVFVNTGTFHWVQNNGYCSNIAWNVLLHDPTQIAAAALITDQNATHSYNSALPLEKVMWMAAKNKVCEGTEFSKLVKRLLICSLAHSQFEMQYFMDQGFEINAYDASTSQLEMIGSCSVSSCHRNTLFNLLFVTSSGKKDNVKITCGNCFEKIRGGKGWDRSQTTIYQQFTMDELVRIFDGYN